MLLLLLFFLTIMNDDIWSMHGGAQHGLRISAFWLLASGSCSRSRFVFCFCIASEISLFSGVWFFFSFLFFLLTYHWLHMALLYLSGFYYSAHKYLPSLYFISSKPFCRLPR